MMPVVDHQTVNDAYLNAKTSKTAIDERPKTAAASKGVIHIDVSDFAGAGLLILPDPDVSLAHLTTVSALEHGSRPYANHEAVAPSEDHNCDALAGVTAERGARTGVPTPIAAMGHLK